MNKINVDEIIRKSKGLRSYKKFNKTSLQLRKLLDRLEKSKDREYNSILKEWIIIKLVVVWEYHFKSLIIGLIDVSDLEYQENIQLSLNDLKKIQKTKQISAGKIFVSTKSLQNFETVEKIISNLIKRPFLKELKQMYQHEIDIKSVKECLEKRHQIIHEMQSFSFKKSQIRKYAFAMMMFMLNSSLYIELLSKNKI